MTTTGIVISIDSVNGFVKLDDKPIYFNAKSFINPEDFDKVKIGSILNVESVATPRGMRAKNLSIVETFKGVKLFEKTLVIYTEEQAWKKEKEVDFLYGKKINSTWHKSPEDAKMAILNIVIDLDLNYIYFSPIQKKTFNNGNYKYTMHSYSAFVGIAGAYLEMTNESAAKSSFLIPEDLYEEIEPILINKISNMEEKRRKQENIFYAVYTFIRDIIIIPFKIYK